MRTPPLSRLFIVSLSLAAMTLACARANLPIVPVTPDFATRQPPTDTPTALPPTATVPVPTDTAAPPTELPLATEVPPTQPPAAQPTAESAAVSPTAGQPAQSPADTPVPPTAAPAQPAAATDTSLPPTIPPQAIQPVSIPANATFTQKFSATNEGGEMIGDPGYLIDGKTVTWAALDGGHTAWVLDLGAAQNMAGVRVYAQKPRSGDPTTLLAIEVSNDAQNWQPVYTGSGDCGEPHCDSLAQMKFVDIGFNPVSARYLRLRSGPTRFGFAEISVAVVP
jgi:hypothetical protein